MIANGPQTWRRHAPGVSSVLDTASGCNQVGGWVQLDTLTRASKWAKWAPSGGAGQHELGRPTLGLAGARGSPRSDNALDYSTYKPTGRFVHS
jgi:hypothetical protein